MENQLDPRRYARVRELLGAMPRCEYPPLVGARDLEEIAKVFAGIPELRYPIGSAGELIEKLGGAGRRFQIAGVEVNHLRMIKYMPAYYFPIASAENFIEKMAELIRANRKAIDVRGEVELLGRQLGPLRFPIRSRADLRKEVETKGRPITFRGRAVELAQVVELVPDGMFPIRSQDDFDRKVGLLVMSRLEQVLIVKD